MDRGTAVPQPVMAGTDTHHGTWETVTLQRLSLRMLGSAGDTGIGPLSHLREVFAGTTGFSLLQGVLQCFFWGFGVFFNYFYLLFLLPCFPLAPLSVAPGSDTSGQLSAQHSNLLSPTTVFSSPKQGQEIRISWGKGPEGGEKAGPQRAGAGVS